MRHAVVLAGGSGTRLWPASRRAHPKQLLTLGPGGPMILAAVNLGHQLATSVLVVTSESQVDATLHVLSTNATILPEPIARNTAAAIGLAAAVIAENDHPNATIVVLPADQHISDKVGMAKVLETACRVVEAEDVIATIGIVPTRTETGFGYLEIRDSIVHGQISEVAAFVEKPERATAERFLASGRHLWNAGIFCMSARRILAELDTHLPETGRVVREIARDPDLAPSLYPTLPSISIDHGVMEKLTKGVVTVAVDVGWDDVGSWAALPTVCGADEKNNAIVGQAVVLEGWNNVIFSDDPTTIIATVGVSDLVVVRSGNAILVIPKSQAQDVRKIVEALTTGGLDEFL